MALRFLIERGCPFPIEIETLNLLCLKGLVFDKYVWEPQFLGVFLVFTWAYLLGSRFYCLCLLGFL